MKQLRPPVSWYSPEKEMKNVSGIYDNANRNRQPIRLADVFWRRPAADEIMCVQLGMPDLREANSRILLEETMQDPRLIDLNETVRSRQMRFFTDVQKMGSATRDHHTQIRTAGHAEENRC